ncbi:MAG: LON peptidase substrate-binding domain-containing protein [Candidatus Paceibacterota bacterium]
MAGISSKKTSSTKKKTEGKKIPSTVSSQMIYPVVPIREGVLFPQTESVLNFGRDISLEGIRAAAKTSNNMVVLVSQRKPNLTNPKASDLYEIGTLAIIERTIKTKEAVSALVRGLGRVQIDTFVQVKPYFAAKITELKDLEIEDNETNALTNHLQKSFRKTVQLGKPVEFLNFMKLLGEIKPGELADQVASTLSIATSIKQEILETLNIKERLQLVVKHLTHEAKVMEIEKDVVHKTQEEFDKHMREGVLRERLRTIQKELGELEDEEELASSYAKKLKKLKVSDDVKEKINK